MMKRRFLSILSVLLVASYSLSEAQTRTWKSPESIFTFDDGTELTSVELSDTATLLSFRRTTPWYNDTLRVHSTTYIIDEQGKRHYTLASYGIPTDEYVRWGNRSEWCYTLKFAPLPSNTKSIDVLIGPYMGNAEWYGVHEAGTDLNIPTPKSGVKDDELRAELMKKGTATVRGHVTNGKDYPVWPVWVLRYWDDMDYRTFHRPAKAVQIHENGDFEFSVNLQRPKFAFLYLGYRTQLKPILLYLEPGETVTLDVRDVYGHGAYLGYSSNQRFRKLLECYPTCILSRLYFHRTGDADGTMKLDNYLIHKYGLSLMEARILRGLHDMRKSILDLHTLANHAYAREGVDMEALERRIFEEDTTVDKQQEEAINKAEDFIDKQKKDFANKMDKNDVSWVFSPFFPSVGEEILPDLNPDNTMHCTSVENMKSYVSETDAILHEYFDTTESPFLLQELSLQNLSSWLKNLTPLQGQDREEVISYLENHYTDPYVKGRVRGVVAEIDSLDYFGETFPVEKTECSTGVVERIYAPFKGKFLQIITINNGENEHILPTIGNLLRQYADSPDVAFLFVSHGNEVTDEDCVNRIFNYFPYSEGSQAHAFMKNGYMHLSDEEYNELAVAFNNWTGDFYYVTMNREGKPLQKPLTMRSEISFSFALNQLLYGVEGLPSETPPELHNGIEIAANEWNTLNVLNYSLNKGKNIRPDIFMGDFGSPLIPNGKEREARRYVYLTKQDKSQPLEFEITKHLRLPSNGTYRIDMLYSIDGDNLSGTLSGEPFTLNTQECHAALKNMTRKQAAEIPVLAPVADYTPESQDSVFLIDAETGEVVPGVVEPNSRDHSSTWDVFKRKTDYWGWNYAQFTVKQENGAGTIDCTFSQDSEAVKKLKKKAINWFCIIDLRITKLE